VCALWIHKTCAGISDEIFNFLDTQQKETGTAYWACRACTAYAKGINHRMREIEGDLEKVKKSCDKNEEEIKKVEREVEKMAEKVDRQVKLVEKAAENTDSSVYEELRERETRRLNVVMYGMGEAEESVTGKGRWEWDIKSCLNLFGALKIDLTENSIKFCRRVGERGASARPLVVGFHEDRDRARLLRADTRGTAFEEVEVCPDLTKRQRQEELGLQEEAIRRNMNLGEDDRSKNLVWAVVGRKGDKRLVKRFAEREVERMRMARGRGQAPRGSGRGPTGPVRGRGLEAGHNRPERGHGNGAAAVAGARPRGRESEEEEVQEIGTRGRLNSKRARGEEDMEDIDEIPVAKH
jgi:flagellar biosynthesis GTPase FlhF